MAITALSARSQPWTIKQLSPPSREISLEGTAAPHGRERKNPVMNTEFELRMKEAYYPGVRIPSRFIFGDKESPIILHGRWMDRHLGAGGSAALLDDVKRMVSEGVVCLAKWGSICSYRVLPVKLGIGREDSANVTWELTLAVDGDSAFLRKAAPDPSPLGAKSFALGLANLAAKMQALSAPNFFAILPDILEKLDGIVSALNGASALLLNIAEEVQDIENATAGSVRRLLGGINQFKTAALNFENAFTAGLMDATLFVRSAQTDTKFVALKTDADVATTDLLALLADFEVVCRRAITKSNGATTIVALDGDTWESLATRALGDPGAAQALKDANGVRYGGKPEGGNTYTVPAQGA